MEEVSIECPHWEPAIQLMEYDDGSRSLRFCYYSETRFGRGPMMLNEEDIDRMASAIGESRPIKDLFSRLSGVDQSPSP